MCPERHVEIAPLTLRHGGLHFSARAAGNGPAVLLLHGFPDCAGTWRPQLVGLAAAGFRAIAPQMRGYEPGSRSRAGRYHLVDLAGDVVHWLDQLGLERCHLVGHDWGSAVAQAVAVRAPERLDSLTLIAVPHVTRFEDRAPRVPRQLRNSWYMLFFQLPFVSEAAVRARDFALIEQLWRSWSPGWAWPPEAMDEVKGCFHEPGVVEAALAYYRQNLNRLSARGRELRARLRQGIPVRTLALCGADDGCIDAAVFASCMRDEDFPAGLRCETLAGAGHFVHQEAPDAVNARLLDWLRTAPSR